MEEHDLKTMSEITRPNARCLQKTTIRSRTLIAPLMLMSPLIPEYIDPRIYKLHLNSRLIEAIEVCFHIAELQVSWMPLLNPVVNCPGNDMKAIGVATLHPRFESALDKQVTMYQFVEECREEKSTIVSWVLEDRLREHD
jgi:hypothetical protein